MKFLKKQALANIASPNTIFHCHSSDSNCIDVFLSYCLRSLDKLSDRINKRLLVRKQYNVSEWIFNRSNRKIIRARSISNASLHTLDWAPIVKANSSTSVYHSINHQNIGTHTRPLAGQTILCVGGHRRLYPEYNQLTENRGGHLVTFHGDSNDHLNDLPHLLEKTDLIICPLDCVNHEAFFIVKQYCKNSGKPCVLLDRSEKNTFLNGINVLSILSSEKID